MAKKFKIGDTVVLKSSGPEMTVEKYNSHIDPETLKTVESDTELTCSWFDGKEKKSASFHQDTLELDSQENLDVNDFM